MRNKSIITFLLSFMCLAGATVMDVKASEGIEARVDKVMAEMKSDKYTGVYNGWGKTIRFNIDDSTGKILSGDTFTVLSVDYNKETKEFRLGADEEYEISFKSEETPEVFYVNKVEVKDNNVSGYVRVEVDDDTSKYFKFVDGVDKDSLLEVQDASDYDIKSEEKVVIP